MFVDAVNAAAAAAFVQQRAQGLDLRFVAGGDDLNVAVFRISHSAAHSERSGFAMDKPAEADSLYPAGNEIVANGH